MLYQSPLWHKLNKNIFQKPVFDLTINDHNYQTIIKQKSIFWYKLNRYQILWVETKDIPTDIDTLKSIIIPQLPYQSGNILIQFWFVDIIKSDYTSNIKKYTPQEILDFEQSIYDNSKALLSKWWKQSIKQNLPEADIIIDTTKDIDLIRADISSNTKNHINKATKKGIVFNTVQGDDDLQAFQDLYHHTWSNKWFWVISDKLIGDLCSYLRQTEQWDIFIVRYEDRVVWWALCLYEDNQIVYLYWGNDTSIGNIWASQFLHWNIIRHAQSNWFNSYDMLGASRIGKKDWLSSVTQFKSWFGWTKYEYLWSFDIVLSPLLYKIYKLSW